MKLPEHLRLDSRGDLVDNRSGVIIRPRYRYHYLEIDTVAQFKATLRAGASTFPGGYPLYLYRADGGSLCFECAQKEAHLIIDAIRRNDNTGGWRVVGCDVNWEGTLYCANCGNQIETA